MKELKELILYWFSHIEEMANDKKTLNGQKMTDDKCFEKIKVLAKESQECVKKYWKNGSKTNENELLLPRPKRHNRVR